MRYDEYLHFEQLESLSEYVHGSNYNKEIHHDVIRKLSTWVHDPNEYTWGIYLDSKKNIENGSGASPAIVAPSTVVSPEVNKATHQALNNQPVSVPATPPPIAKAVNPISATQPIVAQPIIPPVVTPMNPVTPVSKPSNQGGSRKGRSWSQARRDAHNNKKNGASSPPPPGGGNSQPPPNIPPADPNFGYSGGDGGGGSSGRNRSTSGRRTKSSNEDFFGLRPRGSISAKKPLTPIDPRTYIPNNSWNLPSQVITKVEDKLDKLWFEPFGIVANLIPQGSSKTGGNGFSTFLNHRGSILNEKVVEDSVFRKSIQRTLEGPDLKKALGHFNISESSHLGNTNPITNKQMFPSLGGPSEVIFRGNYQSINPEYPNPYNPKSVFNIFHRSNKTGNLGTHKMPFRKVIGGEEVTAPLKGLNPDYLGNISQEDLDYFHTLNPQERSAWVKGTFSGLSNEQRDEIIQNHFGVGDIETFKTKSNSEKLWTMGVSKGRRVSAKVQDYYRRKAVEAGVEPANWLGHAVKSSKPFRLAKAIGSAGLDVGTAGMVMTYNAYKIATNNKPLFHQEGETVKFNSRARNLIIGGVIGTSILKSVKNAYNYRNPRVRTDDYTSSGVSSLGNPSDQMLDLYYKHR